eukprot:TRINITY_DN4267_c0_g2_i1.p1 TRINITY_DN4267_c0_g2~~TRINITY_DN4267_c0_g2_i1.p1  ORF type:complete len:540 (+),score=50.74 TRINITY_DN4267_c0_g2_i1:65-1621(+)
MYPILYAFIALLLAALVMLRKKLWMVWCGVVLIMRGIKGQVGPHVGKTDVGPRVRDVNKEVLKGMGAAVRGVIHAVTPHVPCFGVDGGKVEVLSQPEEFLESVVEKIETAEKRIIIATLYLGTSAKCSRIVRAMESALKRNPSLKATVLVDYGRGQRKENNESVATMFAPLVARFSPERVQIRMFMVPLCGAIFRHAPATIREIAGVQHIKAFVIDNSTLLTGANLNDDYFTNRQDRYIWIHDTINVSNWVAALINSLAELSYVCEGGCPRELKPTFPSGKSHPIFSGPSPSPYHEFSEDLMKNLLDLLNVEDDIPTGSDTYVMPLMQLAAVGLQHEANLIVQSVITTPVGGELVISSAYPNMTGNMSHAINSSGADTVRIVAPAEDANGFYGAKGAKAYVPLSYTSFLASFVGSLTRIAHISLWSKLGWTYHGKGLWFPGGTIIGSTNIGHRSTSLDAELSFLILTASSVLTEKLDKEVKLILSNTTEADVRSQHASQPVTTKLALFIITNILYPFL